MNSALDHALNLAQRGFFVFPLRPNGKLPAFKGWQAAATRDEEQIRGWWSGQSTYNVGISTSKFGDNEALVVVDVDVKGEKHGDQSLLSLELEGYDFPPTCEHSTPSMGQHLIYRHHQPLRQGVDVLGVGLDIRSAGGLIVGPGSTIDGLPYQQINGHAVLAECPDWISARLGAAPRKEVRPDAAERVDPARAEERARQWLPSASVALENQGGDSATYKVAARLKDFGCTRDQALFLMDELWNDRCLPPWDFAELAEKVGHAFQYGNEAPGCSAPEAVFPPVPPVEDEAPLHPFRKINQEYAFIKAGAFVLQETTDEDGNFITIRLPVADFHAWFANQPFTTGKEKPRPISQHWMEWKDRRQYDGVVFSPGKDPGARWYNLWRGFSAEPAATANHPSVEAFKEHALQNVCGGNAELYRWLMGYFAHMIQRPWEKPLVALVFKGGKGVGKNALVERFGFLLGQHFLVADDDRYLLGNFNSHLESNLFFVLDEAAWAGDKRAEGKLKGLITGQKRLVEHKGKEARNVKSLTRVAIIGNEEWLVPASDDERRYAVFEVGEGRKQDRKFFHDMRVGMEEGGYAHLLRFFLDFDLTGIDVNDAPLTAALAEQKMASLPPTELWWLECLQTGQIAGGDFGGEWPDRISTNRLRAALRRWCGEQNIRGWMPTDIAFSKSLKKVAPSMLKRKAKNEPGESTYAYFSPGLEKLRAEWDNYIKGEVKWNPV